MSARPTVTDQIAALHAALAGTRTHATPPMSDEQIAEEMRLEHIAEERKHDRQHLSDRDADYEADRYESRTERWSA